MGTEEPQVSSEIIDEDVIDGSAEEVREGVYISDETGELNNLIGTSNLPDLSKLSIDTGLGKDCDAIASLLIEEADRFDSFVGMDPEKLADRYSLLKGEDIYDDETIEPIKERSNWIKAFIAAVSELFKELGSFEGESCHVKRGLIRKNILPKIQDMLGKMEEKGLIQRRKINLRSGKSVGIILPTKAFVKGLFKRREKV